MPFYIMQKGQPGFLHIKNNLAANNLNMNNFITREDRCGAKNF